MTNPFEDDEHYKAYAKDYIKELLGSVREADASLRRSLLIIASLGFVYFLALANADAAITLFSLRLEDVRPLLALIPAVTAFQSSSVLGIVYDLYLTGEKLDTVLKAVYPRLVENDWDNALLPPNMILHGPVGRLTRIQSRGRIDAEAVLLIVRLAVIILGPVALAVTEVVLYGDRVGWSALSFILVAIVALMLMLPGVVWIRDWFKELA